MAFLVLIELARVFHKDILKVRDAKKKNNTLYYNFSNEHTH